MPDFTADLKQLSRRWFEEVWNKGRVDAIEEMLAPDAVVHGLDPSTADLRGPAAFRPFHARFLAAFPNIHIRVEDVFREGDQTAVRFSFTGTHSGDGLGIAPTRRPVSVTGISIIRWRDGQIIEGWNEFDVAGMMGQLQPLV